jgi:hypothetical protein
MYLEYEACPILTSLEYWGHPATKPLQQKIWRPVS